MPGILLVLLLVSSAPAQQSGDWGIDLEFTEEPVLERTEFVDEERELLQAIRRDPNNAVLLLKLARLYQLHRYYERAITLLETTVKKHPSNAPAHFYLGQIYGSQQRDPNRSLEELHKAVELNPESIEFRQELVSVYFRLQRYPPALEQLEEILRRKPSNEKALYRKAAILYTLGEISKAESIVDELTQHEHARVLKGLVMQRRGEDTKEFFASILKDHPESMRVRYEYAKDLMRERQYDQAQEIFETIIDQDPFYQHAIFQLIKIYAAKKQKEKVQLAKQSLDTVNRLSRKKRNFYRSFLRHHPDTPKTHMAMGLIYLEIGRGNLAAEEFQKVLSMDPGELRAALYLAEIEMASGNYEKALAHLNTCTQIEAENATVYALMAQCYLELKDGEKAREHLQKALQIDPDNPAARNLQAIWSSVSRKGE